MQEVDHIFKILIIGNSSVGKSNILLRFSDNIFNDSFLPTIGVDFKIKNITIKNQKIKLNIWDTAGQERFKTITSTYYKGAHGIILVFDITDRESFNGVGSWVEEVRRHAGPNVVRLLVGNKCDLESERTITKEEAKSYADSLGVEYLETSAKNNINIAECFMAISKGVHNALPESQKFDENMMNVNLKSRKKKKNCC